MHDAWIDLLHVLRFGKINESVDEKTNGTQQSRSGMKNLALKLIKHERTFFIFAKPQQGSSRSWDGY